MKIRHGPMLDRVPGVYTARLIFADAHITRTQLRRRANHSASNCAFRLQKHRTAIRSFRPLVMSTDRCMAAARRIERAEPMLAANAKRLQRLASRNSGRSMMKRRRRQNPSQQRQFFDMTDLSPHAFGSAERGIADVTVDAAARIAACLATIDTELLTDNPGLEISHNCYLDACASLARLFIR